MKLLKTVLILSTSCFLVSSCKTPEPNVVIRNVLRENPEWFVCEKVDGSDRPALPPGHEIDWGSVTTVEQARAEHDAYVVAQIKRNEVVSGYIVMVEGRAFTCWNNMQTQRDFYERLDD